MYQIVGRHVHAYKRATDVVVRCDECHGQFTVTADWSESDDSIISLIYGAHTACPARGEREWREHFGPHAEHA